MQKRRRAIGVLTGILTLCALLSVVFYWLENARAGSTTVQESSVQQQVLNVQLKLQHFTNSSHSKTSDATSIFVPKSADEPGLLREFQSLAATNQVVLQSAQFAISNANGSAGQSVNSGLLSQVQVAITVQGSTERLLDFIHAVQYATRLTGVASTSFTFVTKGAQANISLLFPYQS